jgi:hypothetical protein
VNLSPALDCVGKELIVRRPLSRFIQIDRLVRVVTGAGTQTVPEFYLAHACYTVFVDAEPAWAARSFALLNTAGGGVTDDWTGIPDDVRGLSVPLVQHELPAGNYRMTIDASPTCSWRAQVILNSMRSWSAPPPAWRPSLPPPKPIVLGRGQSPDFRTESTGTYLTEFTVDGFRPGLRAPRVRPMCPFQLALRAADGHAIPLGAGTGQEASWPSSVFLGAGEWHVEMETPCEWELTIRPKLGPSGGGANWF